jgi:SAM-dependent methyltransferase
MTDAASQAYGRTAARWLEGPQRAYVRYAEAMVALGPEEWRGSVVVDIAAGTGAVGHALAAVGARPVALDGAAEMVALARRTVSAMPVATGDVLALPLRSASVVGVTVGFCINHLAEPHRLLKEAGRVLRPGGVVLASTYAADEDHPAKEIVNTVAEGYGWRASPWYLALKRTSALTDTPELMSACAQRAGLLEAEVIPLYVATGLSTAEDLLAWRLGMPELAGFLATLPDDRAEQLRADALTAMGPAPPSLVRQILVLRAKAPGHPLMRSFLGS